MDTIGGLLERNARYYPEKEAFVCGERRLTHRQLHERALRLASGLYRLGMRRQDRVAILSMNCLEYFETEAAAEVAGYIAALINFRLAPPEIAYILKDIAPRVLVFEEQYRELVGALRSQLPGIEHYVCIGTAPDWAGSLEQLVQSGDAAGPPLRAEPDDYVYLYYTSGTTGKPKGVPWTQRAAYVSARDCAGVTEFNGATRVLQVTPAFHIGGKGYPLGAMFAAGTVVLDRGFDPVRMLETIQRERITDTFMVAAMLQAVLDVPGVGSYDLSSVRSIVSAAAPIPVPLLRRGIELLGRVFSIQYGMTEAGSVAAMARQEVDPDGTAEQVRRLASVGHVVAQIDFRLLDGQGRPCAAGEPGEVVIRSTSQFEGYWNNTVATLEAIRDGWYYTGDIGMLDEEGYLFLVDRKKDMIISGGENVYSREVEEALVSHPEVMEAAVIGVRDPKWVEAVKAVVVRRQGSGLDEAALIRFCRTLIAGYKCPKSVEFVDQLPRTATGKVNKVQLRERFNG
jgi:acyl-CoA synthetase (AMP-forming)/AMP-acid ligase II